VLGNFKGGAPEYLWNSVHVQFLDKTCLRQAALMSCENLSNSKILLGLHTCIEASFGVSNISLVLEVGDILTLVEDSSDFRLEKENCVLADT
jgi:hypothetical protein